MFKFLQAAIGGLMVGCLAFVLWSTLVMGTMEINYLRSPYHPSFGTKQQQAERMAAYKDFLSKIPAAKGVCESVSKELYVETDGKRSIWYVRCTESPIVVSFAFNEKNELVRAQPEGTFP